MLPTPYRWIDSQDGSFLHYNYGCVAIVRNGEVTITFQQRTHRGTCGSTEQGKRHVERWILARKGIPGMGKRRRASV